MNIKNLKVGDKVFIREDLEDWKIFGTLIYYPNMQTGVVKVTHISRDYFKIQDGIGYLYGAEMIDWEKTIKLRRRVMNIKDLKAGDVVYIREDLENDKIYGSAYFVKGMKQGVQRIRSIDRDEEDFVIIESFSFRYTPEMIDWEKTEELIYRAKKINDNVYNPLHYSGGGKHNIECYEAIEYILDKLEHVPNKYYGHVFNIVKYIWRCNDKNGYEDLDKARVYLDFMFREDD